MSAHELPQALRLLGVDAEEPQAVGLLSSSVKGDAVDRHTFSTLLHRLLRRDFVPAPDAPAAADARSLAREQRPRRMRTAACQVSDDRDARCPGAHTTRDDDFGDRLARAFVACESQHDGSIAGYHVPTILSRSGIVLDAKEVSLVSSTPRISFETLLALAMGAPARDLGASSDQVLRVHITALKLAPRLLEARQLEGLCVVLRGEVQPNTNLSAPSSVPISLRSPVLHKQAPQLDLECLLPPGRGALHVDLLHEVVPGSWSTLAAAEVDVGALLTAPSPLVVTLHDECSMPAAAMYFTVEPVDQASKSGSAIPQPITVLGSAPASAQGDDAAADISIAQLEAELLELRRQASALQAGASPAGSPATMASAAAPPTLHPWRAHDNGGLTDWRRTSLESLDRAFGQISRAGRGEGQLELLKALNKSRVALRELISDEVP